MSKLVSVAELRERIGAQDITPVNTKLDAALESATAQLSELLRTNFEQDAYKDLFWLDATDHPHPNQWVRFQLSSGFVDQSAAAPVVKVSINFHDIDSQTAIDAENYHFLDEKGIVRVTDARRLPQIVAPFSVIDTETYIQIEYTAGFTVSSDVFQKVPAWLRELAFMTAERAYSCGSGSTDDPQERFLISRQQIFEMAERHIRWFPSAVQVLQ